VPTAESVDSCVVTEWIFPASLNTPAKIVKHLEGLGMTWDQESQKREPAVYKEIKAELGGALKPARKGPKS
jgi:hypothetical protein